MLPNVARTGKCVFPVNHPCLVLGVPAPQLAAVWLARFMPVFMYFHWFQLCFRALVFAHLIPHFRPYPHVTLEVHPGIGNLNCLSLALFLKAV